MNFPLQAFLQPLAQSPWTYLVLGLVGFGFGFVLEMSGFGNSKILAAQFYFRNLTVLKVMFTAIVVGMVLLFGAVGLGLLDYGQVWVNPTYLGSGILGGLIMGVGFIVGGFCPGTSLVSASTGKIDGMIFLAGGAVGAFLFGETEQFFTYWWNNGGYFGRVTLMDVFGLPAGVLVVLVMAMALFMFWGSEQLERLIGKRDLKKEPRLRYAWAAALFLAAVGVMLIGTPDNAEKWARLAPMKQAQLDAREVQIHPGELLASLGDDRLRITMLDVRSESDYNLFHIQGAQLVDPQGLLKLSKDFLAHPAANQVYVVMSNDETAATEAWKTLVAEGVANVYILEGGVNNWLSIFAAEEAEIRPTPTPPGNDQLHYSFAAALGARYKAAAPSPHEWELEYTPKIKLQLKRDKSGGGCG